MAAHNEMPDPKGHSPPLTRTEKDIVKYWIEAGAPANVSQINPNAAPRLTLRQRIVRYLGQFHPPATHFPIALLIVALPAELMWMLTRKDSWKQTVRFCVVLGATTATVAATLGSCDAAFSNFRGASAQILPWHRWFGTATAVWAVIGRCASAVCGQKWKPTSRERLLPPHLGHRCHPRQSGRVSRRLPDLRAAPLCLVNRSVIRRTRRLCRRNRVLPTAPE
jgi:hypothetical protein